MLYRTSVRFLSKLGMPRNRGGFYAVHKGRVTGVYTTWAECEAQVKGFSDPSFKKFPTEAAAWAFVNQNKTGPDSVPAANLIDNSKNLGNKPNVVNDISAALGKNAETFTSQQQNYLVHNSMPAISSLVLPGGLSASKETPTLTYSSYVQSLRNTFYAVHRGRQPGVYYTWTECEAQIKGFEYPSYRKFPTEKEAWSFVRQGKTDATNGPAANLTGDLMTKPNAASLLLPGVSGVSRETPIVSSGSYTQPFKNSFYAVHRGRHPGVYYTWTECEAQIKDFKNPSYRKLPTEEEAQQYVKTGGITKVPRKLAKIIEIDNDFFAKKRKNEVNDWTPEDFNVDPTRTVTVFTDGASSNNGKVGANAGIGVYWGPDHPLNTSMRLPGRQTNNRAEIHAAIHALKQAKQIGAINIKLYTDSQFLIHGITDWINKWKKNGWKLGTGKPVVNKEDFMELDSAREGLNVEWIYIRAHDNNPGNDQADRLAVAGAKKPLSESIVFLV